MKIILFGGNGFIGRNIVQSLLKRHEVTAPTSKQVNLLDLDNLNKITDSYDIVINAASTFKPDRICRDDELMENIVTCFPKSRHIYLGSMSETSNTGLILPTDANPQTIYGKKKYIASQILTNSGASFINLRLFGVFGNGEASTRLIPSIISTLQNFTPMDLSEGKQIRDFINVDVVCETINNLIDNDIFSSTTVNIGSGIGISIRNLIAHVTDQNHAKLFNFNKLPQKLTDTPIQIADLSDTINLFPEYSNYTFKSPSVIKYIRRYNEN